MTALHPAVTGHPHWAAFDAEEAKAQRLLARHRDHEAESGAAVAEWERAMARWEDEQEAAAMDGREPDPAVLHPGPRPEARRLLGRRNPAEAAHRKIGEVEGMRRSWAARMAPELTTKLADADAAAVSEIARHLAGLQAAAREAELARESLRWLAACGGDAPLAGDLFEVRNIAAALGHAVRRLRRAGDAPTTATVPMNLDDYPIE